MVEKGFKWARVPGDECLNEEGLSHALAEARASSGLGARELLPDPGPAFGPRAGLPPAANRNGRARGATGCAPPDPASPVAPLTTESRAATDMTGKTWGFSFKSLKGPQGSKDHGGTDLSGIPREAGRRVRRTRGTFVAARKGIGSATCLRLEGGVSPVDEDLIRGRRRVQRARRTRMPGLKRGFSGRCHARTTRAACKGHPRKKSLAGPPPSGQGGSGRFSSRGGDHGMSGPGGGPWPGFSGSSRTTNPLIAEPDDGRGLRRAGMRAARRERRRLRLPASPNSFPGREGCRDNRKRKQRRQSRNPLAVRRGDGKREPRGHRRMPAGPSGKLRPRKNRRTGRGGCAGQTTRTTRTKPLLGRGRWHLDLRPARRARARRLWSLGTAGRISGQRQTRHRFTS